MRKDRSKNLKPLERSRTSCPPSSQTKKRSSGPVFDPSMRLKEDVKCQYCGLAFNTGSQPMKTHCSRQCRQNHYVYRKTGRRPLSNAQIDRAVSSFALANYTHNIHFKPSYLDGLYRFTCALVILSLSTVAITTPALAASKPNKTEVFKINQAYVERLADAIYLAEGGAKTKHPYGILTKYKTTTPRQACINTIYSKYGDWWAAGRPGTYLEYLASKYAPIGATNDPTNLNQNWLKNVRYFLNG